VQAAPGGTNRDIILLICWPSVAHTERLLFITGPCSTIIISRVIVIPKAKDASECIDLSANANHQHHSQHLVWSKTLRRVMRMREEEWGENEGYTYVE
jgi:hypothetical protein